MATDKIPAHTQVLYDLCDVLDEKATTTKGRNQAYTIALKAARMVIDLLPQTATKAIGAELVASYKARSTSTKQAPADEFDQICQQMADAARARAMAMGGDKATTLKYLQGVLSQVSGQQATSGGSLSDAEKATKEVRQHAADVFDAFLHGGVGRTIAAQAQENKELHDAIDPYKNGHKWW